MDWLSAKYLQFKSELTPYLDEVPSVILRNGAVLWKQAYSRYFSKLGEDVKGAKVEFHYSTLHPRDPHVFRHGGG